MKGVTGILATCNCTALRRASRRVSQFYDQRLSAVGVKATQLAVLTSISRRQNISVNELAEELSLDPTTTTRNLRPLQRNGWILMERSDGDARVRILSMTKCGEDLLKAGLKLWRSAQAEFESRNGHGASEQLRSLLNALIV